jgi:glutathione reductase (NADPH)
MSSFDFDLFVIGAGSGGVRAARIAAGHGARVAVAEERHLGGTCVNVGCVPKKLLAYAAHFGHDVEDARGFGWRVDAATHDWARLIANKNTEIQRLNGIYRHLLEGAGCTLYEARARLVDRNTIEVGGERVTAERILIVTGGRPVLPDEPGAKEHGITSDDAFFLEEMPKRVVVAGGGYIAVEFAGIFNGLGAEVTQLYRGHLFLRGFDGDVRETLAEEVFKSGVDLRFNTIVSRIEKTGDCLLAHLSDGDVVECDQVLYAIGRRPNTADLGLEAAGVMVRDGGAIAVDDNYCTNVENIFAIGDVTDRVNLTPVAIAEGHWLADTLFGPGRPPVAYDIVPSAVFSQPPVATVGLTEAAARERLGKIDIYRSTFRPMKHTLGGRQEKTMMKLVVEAESDRVVGCHMVGLDAPEIVQGMAVAMSASATKADFDRTIGIHPTAAEEFVTMRTKAPDPEEAEDQAAE